MLDHHSAHNLLSALAIRPGPDRRFLESDIRRATHAKGVSPDALLDFLAKIDLLKKDA